MHVEEHAGGGVRNSYSCIVNRGTIERTARATLQAAVNLLYPALHTAHKPADTNHSSHSSINLKTELLLANSKNKKLWLPKSQKSPMLARGLLLVALVLGLPQVTRAQASPGTCSDCVSAGYTWCKGSDFFQGQSVCMTTSGGFFGGCDDISFGASPLESGLDCMFNNQNGEVILAAIILIPLWCGCCALLRRNKRLAVRRRAAGGCAASMASTSSACSNLVGTVYGAPTPPHGCGTQMAQPVYGAPPGCCYGAPPQPVPQAQPMYGSGAAYGTAATVTTTMITQTVQPVEMAGAVAV